MDRSISIPKSNHRHRALLHGRKLRQLVSLLFGGVMCLILSGCGKMIAREATTQLLISDSVDRAIASVDFSDLSGRKIFFDTTYLQPVKEIGFVNSPYVIGSLRQQMIASGCLLQEKKEDAEIIVEGRIGALGADQHEVIYGVPANNLLNAASSVVPTMPQLPTVPEISIAKKDDQMAAAKIALIAYDRESREPIWQSGISQARSTAHSEWLLGAGPFQRGTIYRYKRFAGARGFNLPLVKSADDDDRIKSRPYFNEHRFAKSKPVLAAEQVSPATDSETTSETDAGKVIPAGGELEQSTEETPPEAIKPSADAKPITSSHAGPKGEPNTVDDWNETDSTRHSTWSDEELQIADDELSFPTSDLKVETPPRKFRLFPRRATP
ncbi:MAG: hypothetical protein O2955_15605 [Planctomycetota bacterium]|nr:hypothetical protein [Planctomycetota bacterium]MDA1213940.1 hypothetical protein [Planctomycetota bacterium]